MAEYGENVGIIRMYNTTVSEHGDSISCCKQHEADLGKRLTVLAPNVFVERIADKSVYDCTYCEEKTDLLDFEQMSPTQVARTRRQSLDARNNVSRQNAAQTRQ